MQQSILIPTGMEAALSKRDFKKVFVKNFNLAIFCSNILTTTRSNDFVSLRLFDDLGHDEVETYVFFDDSRDSRMTSKSSTSTSSISPLSLSLCE